MPTERLYYRDSFLSRFTAHVVDVRAVGGKPAIVLDRTAFYPPSGGQPNDLGTLGGLPVRDVLDGDDVLHVVEGAPPPIGDEVAGVVDWQRRFDHMQQHTGQHILSQAFERTIQAHTTSFHLGALSCSIDLDVPSPAAEDIAAAEQLANEIVEDNRPITVHYAAPDDLDRFGLRKPTERVGTIRIVDIAGFDASACGGTHVAHASQVGPIKIRRWERRGGQTRVEFACGRRVLEDYGWKHEAIRRLAERLSVGEREVEAAVLRLFDQIETQKDSLIALKEQLLDAEAAGLLAAAAVVQAEGGPIRVVGRSLPNRSPDDLKRLAMRLTSMERAVALLGSTGAKTALVFAQTSGLPFAMNTLLGKVVAGIGGRGGGTRDLAQGGAPGAVPIDEALRTAVELVAAQAPSEPRP
ncbi:MAG: phosphoesterase [Chloroflexi bacterium]|nr:phosphoesterase [Chloroflexota bacterium]